MRILLILLCVLLFGCGKKTYEEKDINCENSVCVDQKGKEITGTVKSVQGDTRFEISYTKGKRNGLHKVYENNILTKETLYQDGLPEGISKGYHPNGKIAFEMPYVKGALSGIAKYYTTDGVFESDITFESNRITVAHSYYPDGKLQSTSNFDDGVITSIQSFYSEGGTQKEIQLNENGIPHGTYKEFYENNLISLEANYVNGKKEGAEKGYFENGEVSEERNYESGILKTETIYYKGGSVYSYTIFGKDYNKIIYDINGNIINTYH